MVGKFQVLLNSKLILFYQSFALFKADVRRVTVAEPEIGFRHFFQKKRIVRRRKLKIESPLPRVEGKLVARISFDIVF